MYQALPPPPHPNVDPSLPCGSGCGIYVIWQSADIRNVVQYWGLYMHCIYVGMRWVIYQVRIRQVCRHATKYTGCTQARNGRYIRCILHITSNRPNIRYVVLGSRYDVRSMKFSVQTLSFDMPKYPGNASVLVFPIRRSPNPNSKVSNPNPKTGESTADHSARAFWLGAKLRCYYESRGLLGLKVAGHSRPAIPSGASKG